MYGRAVRAIAQSPDAIPIFLLTLLGRNEHAQAVSDGAEPELAPGAFRAATGHVRFLSKTAFFPYISTTPTVSYSLERAERRVAIPEVTLDCVHVPQWVLQNVDDCAASLSVCLVTQASSSSMPNSFVRLLVGPIVEAAVDPDNSIVRLTVREGHPYGRDVPYPSERMTLQREDFPEAPVDVLGTARRQFVVGPYQQIPAYPLDHVGKRFYLVEPFVNGSILPSNFYLDGVRITDDLPAARPVRFPNRDAYYVAVEFNPPLSLLGKAGSAVSAGGGVGLPSDQPIVTIARDIGGYDLTGRAATLLAKIGTYFDATVFSNTASSVLSILRDRLFPQTTLVPFFRCGKLDVIDLADDDYGTLHVNGRVQRVGATVSTTHDVYNVIEVRYNRIYTTPAPGTSYYGVFPLDVESDPDLGVILSKSQSLYGRRQFTIEAPDLSGALYTAGHPRAVRELARCEAMLHALRHTRFSYFFTWGNGLDFDIGRKYFLSDDDNGLRKCPVSVVGVSFGSGGITVTFETEDV